MLAPPDEIGILTNQGYVTKEIEALDGLGLVLARVVTPDGFNYQETDTAIRRAAPDAEMDYNHVYHNLNDRPVTPQRDADRPNKSQQHDDANPPPKLQRDEESPYKTQRGGDTQIDSRYGAAPDDLFELRSADGGAGRSIGVIDTKVDLTHNALKSTHIQVENFVPYEHAQPETHGTSVISILAGDSDEYHGLLPKADIYAASVFFDSPEGAESATTASLVRALDWMILNNVGIVNMSLTGPPNAILKRAIDRAYEQDIIVVAAVGNAGPAAKPLYPAAYDNVIAVTAVSKSNKIYRLANRGDYVDFAAPGVNVMHAVDHGNFAASSGTSMAAPFVAAVLSVSGDDNGALSAEKLNALSANAEDLGRKGFDPVYGYGLIRQLDP